MKLSSSSSTTSTRFRSYFVLLLLLIILFFIYWLFLSNSSYEHIADISHLPQSSLFTYFNISSQIHISETQGILYASKQDEIPHFVSLKSNTVRGNHRHKDDENSISDEVITLLQGQYQFRISNSDLNKYEDHQFDISKTGIIALKFSADKCHALKNIGKQTNWFASYYIKTKNIIKPSVDRQACNKIRLT